MPEKKSAVEVLRSLVEVVRRIERDAADIASRAGGVAAVMDRMIELQPRRQGAAPEPEPLEGSKP